MTKKVKYFFSQWTPQARYLKQYKFNAFRALTQILVIKKMEEHLFCTLRKNYKLSSIIIITILDYNYNFKHSIISYRQNYVLGG